MEGHNTELLKERNKLQRQLDKTRKELEKAKSEAEKVKKETEKVKKEAKKKLSDKGTAPPEPAGVSMALEEKLAKYKQLHETLRSENDVSGYINHTNACIVVANACAQCIDIIIMDNACEWFNPTLTQEVLLKLKFPAMEGLTVRLWKLVYIIYRCVGIEL